MGANTNESAIPSTEPAMDSDGPKPEASSGPITIRVIDQYQNELSFKLKPATILKKAMDVFAEKTGKSAGSLRFFFDGTRVQNDSTPESLGMEDDDQLEAFMEQIGGAGEDLEVD